MRQTTSLPAAVTAAGLSGMTPSSSTNSSASAAGGTVGSEKKTAASDGLLEVEETSHVRFTEDDRLHEVCRMLRSSRHVYLKVEKPPELSELDYRHKLQMRLLVLCRR